MGHIMLTPAVILLRILSTKLISVWDILQQLIHLTGRVHTCQVILRSFKSQISNFTRCTHELLKVNIIIIFTHKLIAQEGFQNDSHRIALSTNKNE